MRAHQILFCAAVVCVQAIAPPEAGAKPAGKKARKPAPQALDFGAAPPKARAAVAAPDSPEAITFDMPPPGQFDFGGDIQFDFGEAGIEFGEDLGAPAEFSLEVGASQQERFEKAVKLMADAEYLAAAAEFRQFLAQPELFAQFAQDSQYQLAKALYKLGFLNAALKRFKVVLEQGPQHRRYRKSVEWLFFLSRRVADEGPVLAELARFRNITFPKAYRNEYRYLLAKYLFRQAEQFEVQRLQATELTRNKSTKAAGFDFTGLADAMESGGGQEFDFGGGGLDFGGGGSVGGLDFGAGGNGGGAAGFDFGGGQAAGLDFGGAAATPGKTAADTAAPKDAKEAIRQGLDLVLQLKPTSRFYARGKYLEGLLHYLDGADQKAVESFQEVVRVLNPRSGGQVDTALRELAFLSLARIHYGYRQFDRSVYYYELVGRDSEHWLTSLFEASWAYYQRGDFDKALGHLLTLHSPFFDRAYFPESKIVQAIILFEACRYPETRQMVDDFLIKFTRVMQTIQTVAQSTEPPEVLYGKIREMERAALQEQNDVAARVVSLTLADMSIRTARAAVLQLEEQQRLLADSGELFQASQIGVELKQELEQDLLAKTREAGVITQQRFVSELYELKGLLAQALRIKIEVARAEREVIERKMRGEPSGDTLAVLGERAPVDDEHFYWPYEGEYWRDELGAYELDFRMCRAGGAP